MSRYGKQFTEEALKPSDEIGLKQAPVQLGLPYQTRADWRSNRKRSSMKSLSRADQKIRLRERERENADLRKANEILKDALGFFAKDRKKLRVASDMFSSLKIAKNTL